MKKNQWDRMDDALITNGQTISNGMQQFIMMYSKSNKINKILYKEYPYLEGNCRCSYIDNENRGYFYARNNSAHHTVAQLVPSILNLLYANSEPLEAIILRLSPAHSNKSVQNKAKTIDSNLASSMRKLLAKVGKEGLVDEQITKQQESQKQEDNDNNLWNIKL